MRPIQSRLPKLLFVVLVAYAAIHFSAFYTELPNVMASHFDAHGSPNGWQPKSAFFGIFVGVGVLATLVGFGIPVIIAVLPPELINLPNKRYWLAAENREETLEFLNVYFAWFGCSLLVVMMVAFDYALQSNLHPENPPAVSRLWYSLAGFAAFTTFWTVWLLAKFLRPPDSIPFSK